MYHEHETGRNCKMNAKPVNNEKVKKLCRKENTLCAHMACAFTRERGAHYYDSNGFLSNQDADLNPQHVPRCLPSFRDEFDSRLVGIHLAYKISYKTAYLA
ncbi:hypothetical protein KIN20_012371 [Parelaphostrongylus tenuis]|uniref:Uncharacterized protein n=1 Tax=Parelaphostrongylus tenuis TaxID=148309 RepID=A0AAD5MWN8_PARTN|nr:hypothetical protein KIN20_012371 [Parelaphostrongylus tenuis]